MRRLSLIKAAGGAINAPVNHRARSRASSLINKFNPQQRRGLRIALLGLWAIKSLLFSAPALAQIQIENALIRALPPGQTITAAYMTLRNHSAQNRSLIGASSELGGRIEIHQSAMENGVMKMRPIAAVAVPAHGSAVLGTDGVHLMIFDLREDLVEGESHRLLLHYADGSRQAVAAVVTKISPKHGEDGHDHATMH